MPLNLASPGIVVREVDLTSGRVQPSSGKVDVVLHTNGIDTLLQSVLR